MGTKYITILKSVSTWSQEELLRVLQSRTIPSPKLTLKNGQTTIQRVLQQGKPCIEKQYFGELLPNRQREAEFLFLVTSLKPLAPHIAPLVQTTHHASIQQQAFYTEWCGLDLEQWHSLLADQNPLMNSVPGLLLLMRQILHACFEFHDLGLVHNDLHWANIVLNYQYDPATHQVTLLPDQIRLIDFEFALRPPQNQPRPGNGVQIEPRVRPEWRDANGEPILLDPANHSQHVCAAEIETVLATDKALLRRYKRTENGHIIPKPQPFAALEKVDFGVDFFTLAQSLKHMIALATPCWDDAHISQWDEAHDFLLDLPNQLESWHTLPEQPRAVPHQQIIRAINTQIGHWRVPAFCAPLPTQTAETQQHTHPHR